MYARRVMARVWCAAVMLSCCAGEVIAAGPVAGKHSENWPQFRGRSASGVAACKVPTKWNAATGENIKWKTPIPGLAHSSPIIWGDRLFVTSAVSEDPNPFLRVGLYGESPDHPEKFDHHYRLYCLNKADGLIIWERTAYTGQPKTMRHIKATHANCTPATDGEKIVAFFGSEGLYCYDFAGKLIWKKDLGLLDAGAPRAPVGEIQWGFASSPIIHDGTVILQCDVRNGSFLAAFDLETGAERWRTPRTDPGGWGTPTVHEVGGRAQILVNGFYQAGGYDFKTGAEVWKISGGGDVPVPTPIVAHNLIYLTSAHGRRAPVWAIRTTATGDITPKDGVTETEHIAWGYERRGNYMQTPLVYGDYLYCCRDNGTMTCMDAKSGQILARKRLGGGKTGFSASPVAADGKVFFTSEEGDVHVIKVGEKAEVLSVNPMGEICMATPAISDGRLFIRSQHHVFCIGE